jgi:hypothetical protein
LQPAAQAGIRCADPVFRKFLEEQKQYKVETEDAAAFWVKDFCEIKSRTELSTNHRARVLWHQLDAQFQAWKLADA